MDISIIIPVYNAEKFISNCLDSILRQDEHNLKFEIIAINDGSTDNSLKILNEYVSLFSNIIVIDSINKGAGSARNLGIENASGRYFWFVDSDDYISEKAFKSLQYSIENFSYDFLFFDYNLVNDNQKREIKNTIGKIDITLSDYFANVQALFLWKHLYKSELILNNDLRFIEGIKNIEDFEFNLQYFFYAKSIIYIEGAFYNYFENPSSTSRDISKDNLKKLASDSHIVHCSLKKTIENKKAQRLDTSVVNDLLGKSIVGFFFSLYKYYTYKELKENYKTYRNKSLLPTRIMHANLKFKIFEFFVNSNYVFLMVSFVKKKIFLK